MSTGQMRGTVVLLAVAACGARVPEPPPASVYKESAPPLRAIAVPGEGAEFVLTYQGLVVGRASVVVSDFAAVDGKRVVMYRSEGATEGLVTLLGHVRWELETTIDMETGAALSDREDTYLGLGDETDHIVREHSTAIDDMEHDIQSAVAAIRGWKSRPGDRTQLDLIFASVRVDVDLWDAGRGHAANHLVPAVRYEGTIDGKTGFVAWMSDDADRVPLEVRIASEYGEILIELVAYRAPRPPAEAVTAVADPVTGR